MVLSSVIEFVYLVWKESNALHISIKMLTLPHNY